MNDLFDLFKDKKPRNDGEIVQIKKLIEHLPAEEYKRYNLCFYKEIDFHVNIEILYPVNTDINSIKDGYLGHYAMHDNILYNSVLTSDKLVKDYPFKLMDEYSNYYEDSILFGIKQEDEFIEK